MEQNFDLITEETMDNYQDVVTILIIILSVSTSAFFISKLLLWKRQIAFEKYLFRFFKLRDDLAYLVLEDKLQQNSDVYEFLIFNINKYIATIEDTDLCSFLIKYIETNSDKKYIDNLVAIVQKCKNSSKEVSIIMKEFEKITNSIITDNSLIFIFIFIGTKILSKFFKHNIPSFISKFNQLRPIVKEQENRIANSY